MDLDLDLDIKKENKGVKEITLFTKTVWKEYPDGRRWIDQRQTKTWFAGEVQKVSTPQKKKDTELVIETSNEEELFF